MQPNTHHRLEHSEVRQRALKGVFWNYAAYGLQFLAQSVALVILARQLGVRDFGVFALGLMIVSIGESMFRMGLGPSLVQLKVVRDEHVDVAWTSNLLLSLAALVLLVSGTALFVHDTVARGAVLVMLTSVLLNSLMSPGLLLLQRNMRTRDSVIISTVRILVRYFGAVFLAFWIKNYWALIIAFLAGFTLEVAMSYVMAWRRPRFYFRKDIFFDLFRFSRWLHLRNIVRWAARYLDSSIVGAFLGLSSLGVYNRALNVASLPNQQTDLLSYRIFFPMFASAQQNPERLRRLLGHAVNVLLVTTIPVLLIMTLHGELLIRLVLGSKWTSASAVLGLLSIGLLLRSLTDLQTTILRAVGQPRSDFTISVVQVGLTGLVVVPCILWRGLAGAPLALIFGSFISMLLADRFMRRWVGASIASQTASVGGAIGGALAALVVHLAVRGSSVSLPAEVLAATAEMAAFFAVQLAIFLAGRNGLLATPHWALTSFLQRRASSFSPGLPVPAAK